MGLTGRNWLAERFEHGGNLTDENQPQYDDDGVGRAIAELHAKKRLRLVAAAVAAIRNVVVVFAKTHREAPVSWVGGITPASDARLSAESRGTEISSVSEILFRILRSHSSNGVAVSLNVTAPFREQDHGHFSLVDQNWVCWGNWI
jgi:hypothetical protein